ncbi:MULTISPECIES: flavin reductase [unclassified Bradyrhizobium]|uniref:flavin reductase n=1 Tax=unclassified Bradyrhizobium TaxID=2631580 RepID=UPI00247A516F|nr:MULTISPECIES: flavin reductase [unclassified Bradyrhizobium]WGR73206.1 flavin reductase family protein [Bradyrhizobium sp. ISRA426]WGR78045.1 flavin reductase family protein [Bradyrhizobium sp. ISRA430]WGR88446.1 flavin reductase family protein [Bradyrhizobium sp. ISRA432]
MPVRWHQARSEVHNEILANGSFGVSVLRSDQEDLALRFGGREGAKGVHRFDTAPWNQGVLNVPLLPDAFCALECVLYDHKVLWHTYHLDRTNYRDPRKPWKSVDQLPGRASNLTA